MNNIDYQILNNSLYYYQSQGYKYMEVPWMVTDKISDVTKPQDRENFCVDVYDESKRSLLLNRGRVLVASGEQSFLQMIDENKLDHGKYVTLTPCFRNEIEDEIHKLYFMKTELMVYDEISNLVKIFIDTLSHCVKFFKSYTDVKLLHIPTNIESSQITSLDQVKDFVQKIQNDTPLSITYEDFYTFDILDKFTSRELGSYGIRTIIMNNQTKSWLYATGCAEPRLSQTIRLGKKPAYHDSIIPKHPVGSFEKILEEVEEIKDAKLANNKVMELVEISDLLGAIEMYTKKEYGITLQDLDKMNKTTQRAFINGRR